RCSQDRTQDDVLRLLAFDPMATASAIPVGDFGFILWVVLSLAHHWTPHRGRANPRDCPATNSRRRPLMARLCRQACEVSSASSRLRLHSVLTVDAAIADTPTGSRPSSSLASGQVRMSASYFR